MDYNQREEIKQNAKKRIEKVYHMMKEPRQADMNGFFESLSAYEAELTIQNEALKAQNRDLMAINDDLTEKNRKLNTGNAELSEEHRQFLSILDSIPEIIYVADFETHEILFANQMTKDTVGRDITGEICYQALQNRNTICEFCTNNRIRDNENPYYWVYYNASLNRHYHIMDRKIKWTDQKEVRFELAVDITQQRKYEGMLENRLRYEKNIVRFSNTLFLDKPDVIQEGLPYILTAANCSRVYIFENFIDEQNELALKQTYEVCAKGVEPQIDNPELQHVVYRNAGFQRWVELLSQNDIVKGIVETFPESERGILQEQDIKSMLVIPIFVQGEWFGYIGFDDVFEEREWSSEDIDLLRAIAEILGLFLENRKNQEIIYYRNKELNEAIATKDRFISILAHDLRSPFNGLLGACELLKVGIDDLPKKQIVDYVGYIDISSKQIFNLLNNLLEWSRIQQDLTPFHPKQTDLTGLIREAYSLFRPLAEEKGVKLLMDSDEIVEAEIDADMINTVIRNLVNNAVKFTKRDGTVHIGAKKTTENVEIEVCDNGTGMCREQKESLFKVGETKSIEGTNGEQGTGFGLLLCKEFVDKHNGAIEVESELTKGTRIKVSLPLNIKGTSKQELGRFSIEEKK